MGLPDAWQFQFAWQRSHSHGCVFYQGKQEKVKLSLGSSDGETIPRSPSVQASYSGGDENDLTLTVMP